jgi:hypothetical protein
MKHTNYFSYVKKRPDRALIEDKWILETIANPIRTVVQGDGRLRKWAYINEEKKYLRVITLSDGMTVHNAFFDRSFKEDNDED